MARVAASVRDVLMLATDALPGAAPPAAAVFAAGLGRLREGLLGALEATLRTCQVLRVRYALVAAVPSA